MFILTSRYLKVEPLALLTEEGSLTELIGRLMGQTPVLKCLFQQKHHASQAENHLLNLSSGELAHIREVTMGSDRQNWMFARTVIPLETLTGEANQLSELGVIPIGQALFGQLKAKRIDMNLTQIQARDISIADKKGIEQFNIPNDFSLWHRCSVFEIATGPLLINEIFLPDCPVYNAK